MQRMIGAGAFPDSCGLKVLPPSASSIRATYKPLLDFTQNSDFSLLFLVAIDDKATKDKCMQDVSRKVDGNQDNARNTEENSRKANSRVG
jgi:hypothetical protein